MTESDDTDRAETLVIVAPASVDTLLSTARECAAVGASAMIVPEGARQRLRPLLAAIGDYTSLVLLGQIDIGADAPEPVIHTCADTLASADLAAVVQVLCGTELPADVHGVASALTALAPTSRPVFGSLRTNPIPVLLAALAAGAHLRVGTADTPETGLTDAQLVARASGLCRLSGRPPMNCETAKRLLVENGDS